MKIIYYSPHPHLNLASPSGYGTHMREMIEAMRELGHEVFPVIMGGTSLQDEGGAIPRPSGLKKVLKALIPNFIWESLKDLRLLSFDQKAKQHLEQQVQKIQPDLIYERANYCQTSGVETARKMDIPHILEVNAPYVEERENLQGKSMYLAKARQLEARQLEMTQKIVVVSSPLKTYYQDRHKIPAEKFLVTPNCVNPLSVQPRAEIADQIKAKYGIKDQTVIGFVGSIQPWHGVDLLIVAFAQIAKDPNLRLLIVGDGWSLPDLQRQAEETGLKDRVIFTGNVPFREVFSYMQVMDMTILAKTAWYCSPVKIFEYGAMKKPVIAMDTASVREVMTHEKDGLLIPPNANALANAIQRLTNEPELAARLAANFHEKVMDRFVWQKTAGKIISSLKK